MIFYFVFKLRFVEVSCKNSNSTVTCYFLKFLLKEIIVGRSGGGGTEYVEKFMLKGHAGLGIILLETLNLQKIELWITSKNQPPTSIRKGEK